MSSRLLELVALHLSRMSTASHVKTGVELTPTATKLAAGVDFVVQLFAVDDVLSPFCTKRTHDSDKCSTHTRV